MKNKLLILSALFALTACGGNASLRTADAAATAPDGHMAQTSLDYEGTYVGILPAADCPGIETTLVLRPDGTYSLHEKYMDSEVEFNAKGTYSVNENELTLSGDEPVYYKIEQNRLRRLTDDRQPVEGVLADHYVLTKKQ